MADQNYQTTSARCLAGSGIQARYIYDVPPPNSWLNYLNCESREEGATSSRFGLSALSTNGISANFPLGAPVNSLSKMQGIGTPYRYAGTTAGKLFRRAGNAVGAFTNIASGLSGGRVSMSPYRPANSSAPWQFIADAAQLLKDNGTLGTVQNWGIAPPTEPAQITAMDPGLSDIELFDEATDASFTLANVTGAAMLGRVGGSFAGPVLTPGVRFVPVEVAIHVPPFVFTRTAGVTTANVLPPGYVTGMRVAINARFDPTFATASAIITVISPTQFTYVNPGPNETSTGTITISPLPSLQVGMSITTTDANAETVYITDVIDGTLAGFSAQPGFIANFTKTHALFTQFKSSYLSGNVAANTTATVTKPGGFSLLFAESQVAADQNYVQLYLLASNPLAITEVTLQFDVGDGTFTQDYFSKAIQMSPAQSTATGGVTSGAAQVAAVGGRAIGLLNVSSLGGDNPSLLPSDFPILQQLQPAVMNPGVNPWTLIQVPLASFVANGAAGSPTNNFSNVIAWRVQIQTQPTLSTTFGLDDLVFVGGSDLNSFAGQPYDYRYTYLNLNTGCESNPSVTMVATDQDAFNLYANGAPVPVPLSVQQQGILVQAVASPDPQVTHWNLYRRGGSLTQAWYFVAQIPIGTLTYVDVTADSVIEVNNQLQVDSDAPVTSLLPTPLNSTLTVTGAQPPGLATFTLTSGIVYPNQLLTLGVGAQQELAYVQSVAGNQVTVYVQLNYLPSEITSGIPVTATTRPQTPMNLSAIAFDQAWLAGDPNNPHILYYSRIYAPETFPSENSIEVGTPDAPIMAIIETRGLLYVATTKTIWQIFGGSGSVPLPVKTGVIHGFASNWGWAVSENIIYYLSYDGIYAFTGSGSEYLTQNTEWIWTSRTETNGVIPVLAQNQKPNVVMAYGNHELFAAYFDSTGLAHRQIFSDTYTRWRNDDYTGQTQELMITGTSVSGTTLSVFYNGAPPFPIQNGQRYSFTGLTAEPWINGQILTVIGSAAGVIQFTVSHAAYALTADTGTMTLFPGNCTAMFFEQDTGQLLVGKDDGMVYIDRVNDFDSGGFTAAGQIIYPIAVNLQTPQLDLGVPKAFKVFNEATVDCTLPLGTVFAITAIFDSQATQIPLGTITGTGSRTQYQLNIETGFGYRSLNMGFLITGNTTSQAIFNEIHIRAVLEAEERMSFDTYRLDHGSASWKCWKQGWFVYAAPDPAGIEMAVYIDDQPIPLYVFTLPQTLPSQIRTTVKVRFPALKGRIIRLVGTSDSPFQMYDKDTELEAKFLDAQKGWQKMALAT